MRAISFIAAVIFCGWASLAHGGSLVIDDFRSNPDKHWRFIADTVMGGVSAGSVSFKNDGKHPYAQMRGTVSTANNGGFIQFRRKVDVPAKQSIQGVHIKARGNGERYFVHIRTTGTILPWQYYQAEFATGKGWKDVRIPLSSFKRSGWMLSKAISPSSIKSVAIVAFGRDHEADVQLREIGWY